MYEKTGSAGYIKSLNPLIQKNELFSETLVSFVRFFNGSDFKDTDGIVWQNIKKNSIPAGNMYPTMSALKHLNIPCGPGIDECDDVFFHEPAV
jgi:hypothetical protein